MSLTKVTYSMISGSPFNVLDYNAKGDGTTNDTTAIQAAIDAAAASGGGIVYIPPGTYRCVNLNMKDNVKLLGVFGAVTLKIPDGVDGQILGNLEQAVPTYKNYFGVEGIVFDGNKANSPRLVAASAAAPSTIHYFYAKDCIFKNASGYGMALQGVPGTAVNSTQTDVYLENCYFIDNGDGLISGGDTYDGIDVKSGNRVTLIGCYASGNKDKGFNIRGVNVTIVGGAAYDNAISGYEIGINQNGTGTECSANVSDAISYSNGGGGFAVVDGGPTPGSFKARVNLTNIISYGNNFGVQLPTQSTAVEVTFSNANIYDNVVDGITIGSGTAKITVSNSIITGNGRSGIRNGGGSPVMVSGGYLGGNTEYGFEDSGSGSRSVLSGALDMKNNGIAAIKFGLNTERLVIGQTVVTFDQDIGDDIASASTVTVPQTGMFFKVTGTTNIDTINGGYWGRVITLFFLDSLVVGDLTGNLALAGNFNATSNDTLTLIYQGSYWAEVCRSPN